MNTFEKLTAPLNAFLKGKDTQIDEESDSRTLFFSDFVLKLVYSVVMQISSLRLLISEFQTSPTASALGFSATAYSTFRDGFSRFAPCYFKKAFLHVLSSYNWMRLEFIDEMGLIKLVDGSLFPTLRSMDWADYKKTKKSIRLHLEFDLNRMIPTEFIAEKANSSERTFLASILRKGMTYVADRGYFSFKLGNTIKNAKAFLVMRVKSNLKLTILKSLEFSTGQEKLPDCFKNFSDQIILFSNDRFKQEYRLVKFSVLQSDFIICTNRFDLTSLQIIMLYAYRWQIELLFKFLKRTLNGIHLFNNSENGVNIQFYIFMIVIILELRLKQICQQKFAQTLESKKEQEEKEQKQKENENTKSRQYTEISPEQWIKAIAKPFYSHWKIGIHWLCHLKNLIHREFDNDVIKNLTAH